MVPPQLFCDLCNKQYRLNAALISHKLNIHKVLEKRAKTSALIANAFQTEDSIYSSDSDCEYRVTTIVERIPKRRKSIKEEEETNEMVSYDIAVMDVQCDAEANHAYEERIDVMDELSETRVYCTDLNYTDIPDKLQQPSICDDECATVRPAKSVFECIYCKKEYKTRNSLKIHMETVHDSKFRGRKSSAHQLKKEKKSYHCKHCDKTFQRRLHYERHVMSLRKDKPFFCKSCQTGFDSKTELTLHKRNNKDCRNPPKTRSYLCTYCGKYFERKNSLTIHTRIHTNEKPYNCTICDKSFIMKSTLREHMNSHSGVKPYICPVPGCEKPFGFASGLRQHRLNMHEPPTFKCPFCDRMFSKKVHMESHSRTHTGEKPYKCEYCNLYFRLTSSLRIHRRTHTGERPFKCEVCHKGFIKSYGLVVHRRNQKKCVPPEGISQLVKTEPQLTQIGLQVTLGSH